MTVQELIAELQSLDPNLEICLEGDHEASDAYDVSGVGTGYRFGIRGWYDQGEWFHDGEDTTDLPDRPGKILYNGVDHYGMCKVAKNPPKYVAIINYM